MAIENSLDEFISLAAQFDVLCAFFHSDDPKQIRGNGEKLVEETRDKIKRVLVEDKEEFSVISCDLDIIWQTFDQMDGQPTASEIKKFRDALQCIRDTIYFTEDGGIVSLGFKFELWRIHFIQQYMK